MSKFMPPWAFFATGFLTLMMTIPSASGVLILREAGATGSAETVASWAGVLALMGAILMLYGFAVGFVGPALHAAIARYRGVGSA